MLSVLDRSLFEVMPIGIDKAGAWFLGDQVLQKALQDPNALRIDADVERMLFNPDFLGKPLQEVQPLQFAANNLFLM